MKALIFLDSALSSMGFTLILFTSVGLLSHLISVCLIPFEATLSTTFSYLIRGRKTYFMNSILHVKPPMSCVFINPLLVNMRGYSVDI